MKNPKFSKDFQACFPVFSIICLKLAATNRIWSVTVSLLLSLDFFIHSEPTDSTSEVDDRMVLYKFDYYYYY